VFLSDFTIPVASDLLEQLVADPELQQLVANQHVAGTPA
jgi:hypothetical protein